MLKTSYIITLLSGIGIFNSCTANLVNPQTVHQYVSVRKQDTVYGNYLAGRLALLRQDYTNAAKYHVKAFEKGFENDDMLSKTYMILTATGCIDKAVEYADKARLKGNDDIFIDVIKAISLFKKGEYRFARTTISHVKEKPYSSFINPLFNAWSYAGEGNYFQAMNEIKILSTMPDTQTVYNVHAGLISEYFNKNKEAEQFYDKIISDKANDVSFRVLQIMSNFFVRIGKKDKASELVSKYYGSSNIKEMLGSLSEKIKEGSTSSQPIIKTVNQGVAEVFLEIALLYKSISGGSDYAHLNMAISEYFNPQNDVAKIAMADIYEEKLMLKDANRYYDSISRKSELYYPAQMRKASNLVEEKQYDEAVSVLKKLNKNNSKNFQLLFNLGDALRVSNNHQEAIRYYKEAIDSIFYETEKHWPVYYSLAISYDKSNQWIDAEKSLRKALELSGRHPQVLNYLGYSLLKYNINTENAASMILEAYEKEPNDSVIMDSLGWVYFKTGDYQNAILYLEKASELNPQNAIISDHLGDAYWLGGRKNEARFLWQRALHQEDEAEELDIKDVKYKIENGLKHVDAITLKDKKIYEALKQLENIAN
jgi:tetratricopeptide (TPR) repeat protein